MSLNSVLSLGRLPEDDQSGRNVIWAVKEGLSPFRVEAVSVWSDYDIDFHRYRLVASVKLPGGYHLEHRQFVDADKLMAYPDKEMRRVYTEVFKAFRYRVIWPIPPTIELGEN